MPLVVIAQLETPMISLETIGGDVSDQVSSFVAKTSDGGFIVGLGSNSTSGPITDDFCSPTFVNRAIFIKLNAGATVKEWSRCYQSSWSDTGYSYMLQALDGGYVIGGMVNSGNYWVIRKEDASGNILWIKLYGGTGSQMLYSMMATDDGGYILFGSAYSGSGDMGFHYGSAFKRDFWVLKVDADGEKVWSKIYGGTGDDIGASVVPAPDGGCYIVGSTQSADYDCADNHGFGDVFVARLDTAGEIIWHKCIGGSAPDHASGGAISNGSGGVLIAGGAASEDGDVSQKVNSIGSNIWLINMDSDGDILWDKCYGGAGQEYANSVCWGTDGTIWVMGSSQTAAGQVKYGYGDKDAWIVHADSDGNFLNAKVLGSGKKDVGAMIYPLSDGSVLGGGYFTNKSGLFSPYPFYGGGSDAFLVKFANWANEIYTVTPNTSISISPNPATDVIQIQRHFGGTAKISVVDIMGRTVYREKSNSRNIQIPISDWHSGMYYVQVADEFGNRVGVQKVVVR